jgi:hypothetical protein
MFEEKREAVMAIEAAVSPLSADPESVSCLSACYVLAR